MQYDKIAEAELQIEDIWKRIKTIRSEQISGENVYQLLLAFDELYGEMDEPGKKELLRAIIERQNYNLPKSEDSWSPETPKEKEEAIIEAFKAFQMIKKNKAI